MRLLRFFVIINFGFVFTREEVFSLSRINEYNVAFPQEILREAAVKTGRFSALCDGAYEWLDSIVGAVIAIFIVFAFIIRPVGVEGTSMVPTLDDGDWLFVSSFDSHPQKGEIVIVTQPNKVRNEPIVKRVIAVGGQEVDIDFLQGVVYVDGEALDEPYTNAPTYRSYDVVFPITVPEGKVFVMGDNRNLSIDSRSTAIGLIDENYVLGRAVGRIIPFGKWSIY